MNQCAQNYLINEGVGKLMLKFSLPCIMSLLVSALYNIVDQIFIGRGIGYLGNGATNVVFPITIIALSFALLIGDGCASYLSIAQGKKDKESSHHSVGNAVVMTVLSAVMLCAIFIIFKNQLLNGFGATKNMWQYAEEYYCYIVLGIPFFMFGNMMNSIIRADGSPAFAMLSTLAGCMINVILDPIAIFVFGWGMKGAAFATVLGQIVSACLALYYLKHMKTISLKKESFILEKDLLKHILPLGISSFLTQISIVMIMGVMNNVLVFYGAQSKYGAEIPLTVVGIVMKVFQIVIAFVVGVAAGSQPVVGYNYGAKEMKRVKKLFKVMILAEIGIGAVAMFCFECFPLQIINLFGSEDGLYNEFAVMAFQWYLGTIVLCCVQKAISIFLQSLGKPLLSMGLSLLRDFVLSVPLILLLPKIMGVKGPLFSAPIADVISFVVVIIISMYIFAHLNKNQELVN